MGRKPVFMLAGAMVLTLVVFFAAGSGIASTPVPANPAIAGTASGNGIQPVPYEDNPSCADFGYDFGFKVEPPDSGSYPFPDALNGVQVTVSGLYFDWLSTLGIDAVVVKGGNYANLYVYDPEASGDSALHAPINTSNNQYYGLSHIEFCYDYELTASKTAITTFIRTWEWDIAKVVDPDELHLFAGSSADASYKVAVDKSVYTDSEFVVSGTIKLENETPYDATITSITDEISNYGGTVTVSCGVSFPYTLPAGETLECTYESAKEATEVFGDTNTATVETSGTVGGGSATAAVIFGDPTTLVNDEITVTDAFDGGDPVELGKASDHKDFDYDRTFACSSDPDDYTDGYYTYDKDNTAEIVEIGETANATVTVHCYAPVVSKDARTSFTRTWEWDIDKTVAPAELWMFAGEDDEVEYTVKVTKTSYSDSSWLVEGTITVLNPHPTEAMQVTLADVVSPDVAATLDCAGSLKVPANETATCGYSAELPDGSSRTNTATATLNSIDFTATAGVLFGDPATIVNDEVTVTDTYYGSFGIVGGSATFTYPRTFDCSDEPGDYTNGYNDYSEGNTAEIVETGDSDDASVKVNCYAPVVTKDADTSFTRTWNWDIAKTASLAEVTLSLGQTHPVGYAVTLTASYTDGGWAVEGTITVQNPNPKAAMTVDLEDFVDGTQATLDCGGTLFVPAGGSATCGYSADLPDGTNRTNTATATLNGINFAGFAAVDFGKASIEQVDECVDVTDDLYGSLGTVCANESPKTFNYSRNVGPYTACGDYQVTNTAAFITNDSGVTGQASATVLVDVPCAGCTLTPGYWKTHSKYGPAPYDDNWANLGEDTIFFQSGDSYYQVLWTAPKGDPYYILSYAYIAAKLNVLNGASSTAEVDAAISWAENFFTTHSLGGKLSKAERADVIANAKLLDRYNNGYIGPGHCTE